MPQTYTDDIITKTGLGQFDLIIIAARRAAQLENGAAPLAEAPGKSPVVVALSEIEQGAYTRQQYEKDFYKAEEEHNEYYAKKSQRNPKRYHRRNQKYPHQLHNYY